MPTRGLIDDRNGVVLADNRPSYNLTITITITITITRERASDVNEELDEVAMVVSCALLKHTDQHCPESRLQAQEGAEQALGDRRSSGVALGSIVLG